MGADRNETRRQARHHAFERGGNVLQLCAHGNSSEVDRVRHGPGGALRPLATWAGECAPSAAGPALETRCARCHLSNIPNTDRASTMSRPWLPCALLLIAL